MSLQVAVGLCVAAAAAFLDVESVASGDSAGELRIGLAATVAFDLLLVCLVALATQSPSPRALAAAVSLGRPDFSRIWIPALSVVAMYAFVAIYAAVARQLGPDWLEPRSTIPDRITADVWTLALAGLLTCLVAPVAEEVFYRGLLTRGLLPWGTWPALIIPATIFSAVHLDPGSFVPFVIVGLVIGWLYWRRGSLTDAIEFHFLFNSTSFVLLVATS